MRTNCAGDTDDRGWAENTAFCVELLAEDWIDCLRCRGGGACEICDEDEDLLVTASMTYAMPCYLVLILYYQKK
jgi:hypothetical protein